MNILVCVKMVSRATYTDALGFESAGQERLSGGVLCMNPADAYALELALRLRDNGTNCHITAMTMGPNSAQDILRDALAMGADEAVLISDPAFAGSDTVATASVLAAAVRLLPPQQLILCGKKAIDSETGHIGPQLAVLLDMPCIINVTSFSTEELTCAQEDGMVKYAVSRPAVYTVVNGTSMVRMPTIMGLRRSKKAEIRRFDSSSIPPPLSGTETLSVTEQHFAYRSAVKETDADIGAAALLKML